MPSDLLHASDGGKMSNIAFFNVATWYTDQVVDWLKGLDDAVLPYVPNFVDAGITGKQLLCFTHHDLQLLNIAKLGHQELILDAIRLITHLHYDLESENLQSLALRLSCKAHNVKNEVKVAAAKEMLSHMNSNHGDHRSLQRLPLNILTAMSDLISSLKQLVSWIDRPPFDHADDSIKKRNAIVSIGMNLIAAAQTTESLHYIQDSINNTCLDLITVCDTIVTGSSDPLTIQPASLELTTLRKKPEDELGMHIQSRYDGIHVIEGVKDQSPADLCGRIDQGDEVVQVNCQTVVGWPLKKLVAVLKDNKKEVTLTLKKRPRHANPYGLHTNKRKMANKLMQATFPKALRKSRDGSTLTTRSPLNEFLSAIPPPSEPFSESVDAASVPDLFSTAREDINVDSSSVPDLTKVGKYSASVPDLSSIGKSSCRDDTDTESEVFSGRAETLDYQLDAKQRRATVSGGSPTLKRPSIRVSEFTSSGRAKSQSNAVSSPSSEDGNSVGSPTSDGQATPPGLESPSPFGQRLNKSDGPLRLLSQTSDSPSCDSIDGHVSPRHHRTRSGRRTRESDSPKRRQASKMASREIPGEVKGSPQLVRVVRIDSQRRTLTPDRDLRRDGSSRENSPSPGGDKSESAYSVTIVGGVAHKVPARARDASPGSPNNILRKKTLLRKVEAEVQSLAGHRRISCKDLGNGECQGWLWKRREAPGVFHSKWVKRWFVLKQNNLYYYRDVEDLRAKGVIYLPGFQISPAPEIKSKKHAFKAHHSGTTFYFASDRQEDMGKWMNRMGLAAIIYGPVSKGLPQPPSPRLAHSHDQSHPYYSESDDEDSPSSKSSITSGITPSVSPRGSREDLSSPTDHLAQLEKDIRKANLTLDGANKHVKRASVLTGTELLALEKAEEVVLTKRLLSLERTLKDKERELTALDTVLSKTAISSTDLSDFKYQHPIVADRLNESSSLAASDSTSTLSVSEEEKD